MKLVGWIIIIWGIADVGLSWASIDLYSKIGIQLPELIYPYTGFIAMAIGGGLTQIGGSDSEEDQEE